MILFWKKEIYQTFFMIIAASALLGLGALFFMKEPDGHITEVNEDGTVELISVT